MNNQTKRLERLEQETSPHARVDLSFVEGSESNEDCLRRLGKLPSEDGVTYIFVSFVASDPEKFARMARGEEVES